MSGTMKRLAAIFVIALLASTLAFAQGNGAAIQGKVVVWAWPSADKAFESIIKSFNAQYPNIEVTWVMKPGQAGGTRDALQAAIAAGSGAPDVCLIEINDIGTFALTDAFVNLLDKPYNAGKYKADMVPYKWNLATTPAGKLFAFPWDIGPASIFYRRDILDKAGVPSDPETLSKLIRTWDDYVAIGKKVNDPANKVWWTDNARNVPYIYYAHKNFFDANMNVAIDNQTTRRVLTIASQIRNAGMDAKASAWTDEWYTMLSKGNIATTISGCWFGGFLKSWIAKDTSGKWGIIPIPEQPLQN
jgi:multiple sugar transport system substrate-binding protein